MPHRHTLGVCTCIAHVACKAHVYTLGVCREEDEFGLVIGDALGQSIYPLGKLRVGELDVLLAFTFTHPDDVVELCGSVAALMP